jgi:tRNA threonylcarbamoyladenosine biosynthesis protein TsaE
MLGEGSVTTMAPTKTTTRSVDETRSVGAEVARRSRAGDIYALIGKLGTGKTEFVRGFVAACDESAEVHSPSFPILNIYDTPRFPVYHFDFYRLRDRRELVEIGFGDYLDGDGVCLIEWADLFMGELPAAGVKVVRFEDAGENLRTIEVGD